MARTVDEKRHQQRRLQIIDAALTSFAADGFDGTTTAAICRTTGIGSAPPGSSAPSAQHSITTKSP
ncbi:TetR/AcrR family transcriptional regulator [Nocardia terpenica]|nr:TetR/AcrR family transcriptional regulator [Nocardia terpenica]MBF6102594.1 TetR/AcrR family transcriptional regulator [Nocardia terpenica]MBF6111215.1 TetR/AcrR family transcriptional regulator [Nocardia terpenica]MBF6117346.1 TetR/AcrR family transcriptional regulator [Nocardia terpenica]MBF6150813.1 TetR/AcrR family transcriptional regulator [Nocardia terpenica]